jgi:hypothetical protein
MDNIELKNIDTEDIEDLLIKIEDSFGINFADRELIYIETFGQLCDYIRDKIKLDKLDDCTTQQAFYKIRDAFETEIKIDKGKITPDTILKDLLPRKLRKMRTKAIENKLGFKLSLLRPPEFMTVFLVILLLLSIIGLFFSWQYGLSGLLFSTSGFWIANKTGNVLSVETIGQLANKMTRENYLKSRRKGNTFNDKEIEKVLIDIFSSGLLIDKSKLTKEARLYK